MALIKINQRNSINIGMTNEHHPKEILIDSTEELAAFIKAQMDSDAPKILLTDEQSNKALGI